MIKTLIAGIAAFMMLIPSAQADRISEREAAAIALGTAAILAGVAIASQRPRKPRHYNHHYHNNHHYHRPHYHGHPYPLRYRYQEPRYYRPYHHYRY